MRLENKHRLLRLRYDEAMGTFCPIFDQISFGFCCKNDGQIRFAYQKVSGHNTLLINVSTLILCQVSDRKLSFRSPTSKNKRRQVPLQTILMIAQLIFTSNQPYLEARNHHLTGGRLLFGRHEMLGSYDPNNELMTRCPGCSPLIKPPQCLKINFKYGLYQHFLSLVHKTVKSITVGGWSAPHPLQQQ